MERNQRGNNRRGNNQSNRGQAAATANGAGRNMQNRVGLRKKGPSQNSRPRPQQRPGSAAQNPQGRGAPRPQQNPQKPDYRQGAPRQRRRITQAEQLRIRRNRTILGAVCVLAVLILGLMLSINLLFKITDFRVENTDRSTPANTGIYTEQQIIDLTGLQVGDNLFGFSTKQKGEELLAQLPYLNEITVNIQMPGTVVIKVKPEIERFMLQYGETWLVLSDGLKVLRTDSTQPEGCILLEAPLAEGQQINPGTYLKLQTYNSLDDASAVVATDETALSTADDALREILKDADAHGLLGYISVISMQDMSELSFLYQGRVSVKLGTANNLDYKIRLAAQIINDPEKGLGATDHGTLDVSYQRTDGEIWGYFQPAENTPEPPPEEPAPENAEENPEDNPEEGSEQAPQENAEENPGEAAAQE